MESLTAQETFNLVKAHLLTQRARAMSGRAGGCAYRGEGGLKCAIGYLIPDELYSTHMEGHGVHALLERFSYLREVPAINHHDDLLSDLQRVHDQETSPLQWEGELREVAARFNLQYEGEGQ